jgi:endogenous inhibitor of DNA gyrase (YacG/DUF329 family)
MMRCPICDQAMETPRQNWPHWPFCTRRCKLIDLGRWLGGSYRIEVPVTPVDLDDETFDSEIFDNEDDASLGG